MKWFVISPINGLTVIDDDSSGRQKVTDCVSEELSRYKCYRAKDYLIFRGERHEYVPPSQKGNLVQTDRRN